MIFDIDKLLGVEELEGVNDRLFPADVFLSHRRFDLPSEFLREMSNLGVAIAWDQDLDLWDRRVIGAVARAMEFSRYVALYVSNSYTDSP